MATITNKVTGALSCPNCEFRLEITGQVLAKDPLPPSRKTLRRLTPESRKNVGEAQRKRWAEYRAKKAAEVAERVKQIEASRQLTVTE